VARTVKVKAKPFDGYSGHRWSRAQADVTFQTLGLNTLKKMASLKARRALQISAGRLQQLGGRATGREIAVDLDKPLEQIQPRFSGSLCGRPHP